MLNIFICLAYVSNWGIWPFWAMTEDGSFVDPSEHIIKDNLKVEKVYKLVEVSLVCSDFKLR